MAAKKESQGKAKGGSKTEQKAEQVVEGAGPTALSKNPIRTLMFKDLMLDDIVEGLRSEQVSKDEMEEVLFLTVTNAVLERVGQNLPEELLMIFQENLDDYLAISMVNEEHKTDLLDKFREDFLEAHGDSFQDERDLMEALTAYEDEWWGTPKSYLGGKVPNELMDSARDKMEHILHDGEECDCGCEPDEGEYWASRSYIVRDLWFSTMNEAMSKESMPTPQKRERLFVAVTNALLDTVVNVMPDFMSEGLFDGLDHDLELSLVNKASKIDVLQRFEAALMEFEEKWWGTPMKELGNKSPYEAMEAMARKYGL